MTDVSTVEHDVDVHLERVTECAVAELDAWPLDVVGGLRDLIRPQVVMTGKRLRPRLAFAAAAAVTDSPSVYARLYAPAASAELYHLAALILDDIEDNSDYRRGAPAVHTTAATSTAINVAATIRSLAYHPVHRSPLLSLAEKYEIHRRLDTAATLLVLGQSIDIGWHNAWYPSVTEFPYDEMIRWKTGVLFGYSAWCGAFVAGAEPGLCEAVERFGVAAGALYQMIDDYQDVFGAAGTGGAGSEDLRDGKATLPLRCLVEALAETGRNDLMGRAAQVPGAETTEDDVRWLQETLHGYGVRDRVRQSLLAGVASLSEMARGMGPGPARSLGAFLDLLLEPLRDTDGRDGS